MELWKISHQKPLEIEVRYEQLLGLEPELLILRVMVGEKDRSLHVSRIPTWLVQLYLLEILHPRHKLYIPMCGYFKE